jgi:hypothetical protein
MYLNGGSSLSYPVAANALTGAVAGARITYEFWYFCTGIQAITAYNTGIAGAAPSVAVNGRWTISLSGSSPTSTQQVTYYWTTSPSAALTVTNTTPLNQNQWNHVAICIDATTSASSTITIYTNGIGQTFTGRDLSSQSADPGYQQYIGSDGANQGLTGYIRDFRIVRGSLVYTSNFTPPTTPLTAIAGTVLLACQDNRFIDNSAYNWTLGAVASGTPQVQTFSPYVPTVTTPTTYSYMFTAPSVAYLDCGSQSAYSFGTGIYTIEFWVNPSRIGGSDTVFASIEASGTGWYVSRNNNAGVALNARGSGAVVSTTAYQIPFYTWSHVVITRASTSSNQTRIFINGVLAVAGTDATNWSATGALLLMTTGVSGYNAGGALSNFRLIKGSIPTAYQTSSTTAGTQIFAVPTSPLTTSSQGATAANVSLLTCQSSTIVDNSNNAFTLTPVSTVSPVTSPVPFAPLVDQTTLNTAYSTTLVGGSGYFDGNDYLTFPSNAALSFGTGDYTVEAWVYFTSVTGAALQVIFRSGAGGNNFYLSADDNQLSVGTGSVFISIQGTTFVANTWYHVAACRTAGTLRLFSNGVQIGSSVTDSTNFVSTGTAGVGSNEIATQTFSGYMSNVRVNKSSLYTTNFAPPPQPLTPIANTGLLLNFTNAAIIDNTSDNVLETVGNARISTVQSKYGGSSMFFDGTGDQIISPNSPNYFLIGGNFTVELWLYLTSSSGSIANYSNGQSANSNYSWELFYNAGTLSFSIFEGNTQYFASSTALTLNAWSHIAAVRNGSTLTLYVNGVAGATTVSVANVGGNNPNGATLKLSGYNNGTSLITGYIDDFRITKGVARYVSNFTPPTSQLQDQ